MSGTNVRDAFEQLLEEVGCGSRIYRDYTAKGLGLRVQGGESAVGTVRLLQLYFR